MDFFISNAFAQTTPATPNAMMQFMPLIMIGFVFYFLIIKPQKKKMQEEQSFVNSLEKGSEVYTKSGILGTITGLTDKVVTLEISDGVKLKVLRSQVAGLVSKLFEAKEETKK